MSFVFPVLLGGLLLIGIPILLHLIMRQKPKILPFPAFRFLLQQHRRNLRKLQLRHLLLLALRIFVMVAICLALARPKLFHAGLNIQTDRAVAAILLFDTSMSMEYKTSDGLTRLEEAKKHALELLAELPDGSRLAILDTADPSPVSKSDWLGSLPRARERIQALKLKPANHSVSQRLENAQRLFAALAGDKDDDLGRQLPRFLAVFSDRTKGCWESDQRMTLYGSGDQVPPSLEGLQAAREVIPGVVELLRQVRHQLPPPAGQDYPEAALVEALQELRDQVPRLNRQDLPPAPPLAKVIGDARRACRDLLDRLPPPDKVPEAAKEYHAKLWKGLQEVQRDLGGYLAVFVDVGVDNPVDLAIVDLELPRHPASGKTRQVFGDDEKILLQAHVQATGNDFNTMLACQLGKKTFQRAVVLQAGQREAIPFEIDIAELKLGPGFHQVEVRLATPDLLPANNTRFATFAIRAARKALVLADVPAQAEIFLTALRSIGFSPSVLATAEVPKQLDPGELARYQAVYLFNVAQPDANLWGLLEDYVHKGGGVGLVPGGEEVNLKAYHEGVAQKLMPGQLTKIVKFSKEKDSGAVWDLSRDTIFQHPIMRPFRDWRDNMNIDFIRHPRQAYSYWEVQAQKEAAAVLVDYADNQKRPALLQRQFERGKGRQGRVLLFTTTLDGREPRWNNYPEALTSFYVVLAALATNYLAGDLEEVNLNYLCGQAEPVVALPLSPRYPAYTLRGPDLLEPIAVGERQNDVVVKQAVRPGNYALEGLVGEGGASQRVAAFSVNLPARESDLERVAAADIESVLGAGAVVPLSRRVPIRDALRGHFTQPLELFPLLMVLLLFALALENLLANKFYRLEPGEPRATASG